MDDGSADKKYRMRFGIMNASTHILEEESTSCLIISAVMERWPGFVVSTGFAYDVKYW
jgi:hypothetical protein